MYVLNHNPSKRIKCKIIRNPTRRFWQLIGKGIIAESHSWQRLKEHAETHKLKLITLVEL